VFVFVWHLFPAWIYQFFKLKSIWNKETTMPVANLEKKCLSFSNVPKVHTSKLLKILTLLWFYCYGSYSQKEYIIFSFGIDLKDGMNVGLCEHQKRSIQVLKIKKFTRVQCSYFSTKWGYIDMVPISSMNKPSFNLKSIWSPEGINLYANL
jgi:hypothetical protein